VQRGVGHGDAADKHRRQFRNRCELAGAAHLHLDSLHRGQHLLRRILVRHRPARLARDEAQALLQRQAIDLVDHAVDVVRQAVAQFAHATVKGDELCGTPGKLDMLADRKAP